MTNEINRKSRLNLGADIGIGVAGVALAIALVMGTQNVSRSIEFAKRSQITVKGFAAKSIVSDLAIWEMTLKTRNKDLAEAYKKLEIDRKAVLEFLQKLNVPAEAIELSATRTGVLYKKDGYNETNIIEGYSLEQSFVVRHTDVNLVQKVASDATELLKNGIEVSSNPPRYYYSGLDELKVEMLALATRDARTRAQTMAENSESKLGVLRSAQQGVFQITPENSVEVSGYGENDTSSLKKVIRAIVTVEYSLL